ncbi:hypothetical protein EDD22DRAFT_845580 [Suillus occidentalis]|nr:hypothetical protein EDD22DRAFT_845580 [Suillus occidentalis]
MKWPKFTVVVKVGESINSLIINQIKDTKSLSNIYSIADNLQEVRALRGGTLCSIKVSLNEVVHRILEVPINKRQSSAGVTKLELGYAFGLQSKASRSMYPPRPGQLGSPGGFGIFESSDKLPVEVDESLSLFGMRSKMKNNANLWRKDLISDEHSRVMSTAKKFKLVIKCEAIILKANHYKSCKDKCRNYNQKCQKKQNQQKERSHRRNCGTQPNASSIKPTSQHTAGTEGIKVWDIKSRKELTGSIITMSPKAQSAALSGLPQKWP